MILDTAMLYLYVETPLHAGTGSGLSSIDLPIQRERTTQYPMIQGSSVKGKLRSAAYRAKTPQYAWTDDEIAAVFGPEDKGADHAGALIAGDARLLLFPIRSLNGVFAYTTSFDILHRFLRDMKRGDQIPWSKAFNQAAKPDIALVPKNESFTVTNTPVPQNKIVTADNILVLEEFSFTVKEDPLVGTIAKWIADNVFPQQDEYKYWREKVKTSLVILPDNDFRDFVVNATEIITRIRIKRETKTVEGGALWTEEHLPTDTVLYVPIYATDSRKVKNGTETKSEPMMLANAILDKARSLEQSQMGYLQIGGDETVGRGMVCMHWEKEKWSWKILTRRDGRI